MAKILCTGIATLDIINTVKHYPDEDDESRILSQDKRRGGNATNTAVVLSQLGHQCSWAGALVKGRVKESINEDNCRMILADLEHYQINYDYCQFLEQGTIPTSYITLSQDTGSRTISHYRDMAEYSFEAFKKINLQQFDWFHFEGRNIEQTQQMMLLCKHQCPDTPLSLEIEKPRNSINQLIQLADIILFSKQYAEAQTAASSEAFCQLINSQYPDKTIICAWGDTGAGASFKQQYYWQDAMTIQTVDTLGAGDVFNAAIIDQQIRQSSMEKSLHFACRLAAGKCAKKGIADLLNSIDNNNMNTYATAGWEDTVPTTQEIEQHKPQLDEQQQKRLIQRIKQLLIEQNAVLVAHYYTDPILQQLADETGGCVSDSLEMARFGQASPADKIIVAGVRFMGETAKILSPEKTVFMPDLEATCSLDLGCSAEDFIPFCDAHPDHTVVVYANTSAKVKARADWVVTSGIAVKVIKHLASEGKKILWAPDRHLGKYIQSISGADMLLWQASCLVHDEFKANALLTLKEKYPDTKILVHPESPYTIVEMADFVGSTTQLINAVKTMPEQTFIVATDNRIFYKMQQAAPDKTLIEAPTGGEGATCTMCAHCSWMAMNTLQGILNVLEQGINEVHVEESVRIKAYESTQRLLDFAASIR